MAAEGSTQALVAAFFFGIVLNAASAAVVIYTRGYGKAIFRDSQRLVLVSFLLSSALWALTDFITILLDVTSSSTSCQIGVIFSTIFDQLARFSIEQFLLWALNNHNTTTKVSVTQLIPQVMILVRFLVGAVFIGFTRPQTDAFCVATTSTLAVGILVPALDAIIILLLVVRAYSAGGIAKENREGKGTGANRATALMSVLLGLALWTGMSVPLLLGIKTISLAVRTALPAGGLLVVIVLVSSGAGTLLTSRTTSRPPEAPSPRRLNISRDISTSDSDYPPSRYEDIKEAAIRSSTTFVNPREAPRVKDETMVGFAVGMDNTFPGEPMPPLPVSIAPVSALTRKLDRYGSQKKGLFEFGKGAKMAIGNPILQENAQNPLNKIAVMDLQEAAVAERERRARIQEYEGRVNHADVKSMGMTPEEGARRAVSVKRKEVASVSSRQSEFPGSLQPEGMGLALTTSAQLSPGGDETRRRSPRQSIMVEAPTTPMHTTSPSQDRPLTILPQYNFSQQALTRPDIRPSRMLPPSPKTPPPEPTKTPLQRRPTIGLPTNPRARGLKIAQDSGSQHKTILFVNNIEYNDPLGVETIIKGATVEAAKTAPIPGSPAASVVNRPRPIPRKAADSPAQSPTSNHRRSRSAGSFGRKSFLSSAPGSPTQLPPLPPLPRGASTRARPLPNDTRSMTVEEKITLLFPSPPSGNAIKRRSSVPEMPPIPLSFMDTAPFHGEPNSHFSRTTKASTRAESILEVDEIPVRPGKTSVKPGAFSTMPAIPVRSSAWTETTDDRTEDDATTNWSRVQSLEFAVGVPVGKIGLPSSIRMPGRQDARESNGSFAVNDNRDSETLPIMLDTSSLQQAEVQSPWFSEGELVATPEKAVQSQWHRRVGDECPTFSARKEKTRSRKMPPPTPLMLNSTSTRRTIAIQVEPSPLESPNQAFEQIQAQLRKLDTAQQNSPQSALRRLALLENLEKEMGEQADHWQEIKHDFERDSMSTIQTTSPSGKSLLHESLTVTTKTTRESLRSSIGADRRASRVARLQNNGKVNNPASVRDSGSPQMSKWQKRLTEAQLEYMDAQVYRSSNVNFLQLSRAQLASPTPPDSDESDQSDNELLLPSRFEEVVAEAPMADMEPMAEPIVKPKSVLLWTSSANKSATPTGFMWTFVSRATQEAQVLLPGLSVRPAQRKEMTPLQIHSSQLWRKPYSTVNRSTTGLWRPIWASAAPPADPVRVSSQTVSRSQSLKAPRPVTQRPPRRNKRVTLLPDILESPKPLPDKRGTLGIFQFPWGERSDTAFVQSRPSMPMAMPGTMTSGGPPMGAQSKTPEETEYSSSFFDDYDEEENGDSSANEDDSEDEFDETTLWEIASLLKSDAVPSRDSLLPPSSSSVVDDYYVDELVSDEEGQSSREQSIVIGLSEPRELMFDQPRQLAAIESSTLSMLEDAYESKTPSPKQGVRVGLPANPKAAMIPQNLAAIPALAKSIAPQAPVPALELSQIRSHAADTQKQGSTGLWNPLSKMDRPSSLGGLFVSGSSRSSFRTTAERPAAQQLSRKPRPAELKPLEMLTSASLWTLGDASKEIQRVWILGNPKHKRLQRLQATSQDWKAALHEAISASYPHLTKAKRITASLAEWKAALHEAISLSMRLPPTPPQPAFDAAVRHPVFGTRSPATQSEWSQPAATGHTTYDVASVHPAFAAYAGQKKLPRQPSDEQNRSRSEDFRAQQTRTTTIERDAAANVVSPASVPVLPETSSRRDAIQAQIEALEQERLFAQQFAQQQDYRRRQTSMGGGGGYYVPAAVMEAEPEHESMPAGAEMMMTVQDLQRQLSGQIRQSLVFGAVAAAAVVADASEEGVSSTERMESVSVRREEEEVSAAEVGQLKVKAMLWTQPIRATVSSSLSTGLWTAGGNVSASSASGKLSAEDAEAMARRAGRRKTMQKMQRRAEILGQIAAVEAGRNPFVDFEGQGLWTRGAMMVRGGVGKGRGRDWLGSVNMGVKSRGVVLRY